MNNKQKKFKNKYKVNIIDGLDNLQVNTVIDITQYKDFKYLDIEKRLIILNNYLDRININEDDKNYLISLIQNNSLKNKNEIVYDKINGYIKSIKILEYNSKINLYQLKKDDINNKNFNNLKKNIDKFILT